jgi:hypothetical protein
MTAYVVTQAPKSSATRQGRRTSDQEEVRVEERNSSPPINTGLVEPASG